MTRSLLSETQIENLNRDLRILIATNGTLTRILEIIVGDDIVVDVIKQQLHLSPLSAIEFDDLPVGQILQRQIVLRGRDSRLPLVAAESFIAIDNLPQSILTALTESDRPIGEIMAANCLETFKEAAEVWVGELPYWVGQSGHKDRRTGYVARRYRIIIGGQPLIALTEYFLRDALYLPGEESAGL